MPNVSLLNLQTLNLRDNQLTSIDLHLLSSLANLRLLSISGNPLSSFFLTPLERFESPVALLHLDMSRIHLPQLDLKIFFAFPKLQTLNLSGNSIERVISSSFHLPTQLRIFDARGSAMPEFPSGVFQNLTYLELVRSENYNLCCPKNLPHGFELFRCQAPRDLVSSCDFLLRSPSYTVFVSLCSTVALFGNIGAFFVHVFVKTSCIAGHSADAFLTHLSVSEFLMGAYLAVIGLADRLYRDSFFLWSDRVWRQSATCNAGGFLAVMSMQVSVLCLFLAALDRVLVHIFRGQRFVFRASTAHCACALAWGFGLGLASVPLLPLPSHWGIYSETSICLPVPFSQHSYSFGLLLVNFILSALTACLHKASTSVVASSGFVIQTENTRRSDDHYLTRRLHLAIMITALCWILASSVGFLSFVGIFDHDETNVAMVLVVLPLRSALSPCVLGIGSFLERRRQAMYRRLHQRLASKLNGPAHKRKERADTVVYTEDQRKEQADEVVYTEGQAYGLLNTWLSSGLLSCKEIKHCLNTEAENIAV